MNKLTLAAIAAVALTAACCRQRERIDERAAELCHSNPDVIQAVRIEQLSQYVRRNRLGFRYCQDYGWLSRDLRIEN